VRGKTERLAVYAVSDPRNLGASLAERA
jgi:hypothetical protein